MNQTLPLDSSATMLDAHSFVWIVSNDFYGWNPDSKSKIKINDETSTQISKFSEKIKTLGSENPERRDRVELYFVRDQRLVESAHKWANGNCQLCGKPAPFKDKNEKPYLEVHHIVWLSRGGSDSADNMVALCPNCHSKMHIVDNPDDVIYLKDKARKNMSISEKSSKYEYEDAGEIKNDIMMDEL